MIVQRLAQDLLAAVEMPAEDRKLSVGPPNRPSFVGAQAAKKAPRKLHLKLDEPPISLPEKKNPISASCRTRR